MKCLITGRGGSGKTTVAQALKKHGYNAVDADDVPGLARWENAKTGQPVAINASGYVDYTKIAWNWNGDVLQRLLAAHGDVFVCGSASNQADFYPYFDKIFILALDPATHTQRLQRRPSVYGKQPQLLQELVAAHQDLMMHVPKNGATLVNAAQPLPVLIKEILHYADA